MKSLIRTLWGIIAVVLAIGTLSVAMGLWSGYEIAVERRALDVRASELVQRALAPGSALACLDATASTAVETACEKALFASPEALAAAVAYVDAKLTLLADSIAHAARDNDYADNVERLRRGLEADRFGLVAQALTARGCTADTCDALGLFRNPWRIVSNLRQRTYDTNVVLHASAWRPGRDVLAATAPATTASVPSAPLAPSTPSIPRASTPTGVPVASKYDFPSAASIPPVSIMDAEPPLSKHEQAAIAAPVPAPPATTTPTATTPTATNPAATPQRRPPASRTPAAQPAPVPLPVPAPR